MQYQQTTNPLIIREAIPLVTNEQTNSHPIDVNEFATARTFLMEGNNINYQGASSELEFDSFGDPEPNIFFWTIDNGKVIRIKNTK
jgi:hypothetical protein